MNETLPSTPALRELMAGYLHQDYDLIGSIEDNVNTFIEDFPDLAPALPAEVTHLLNQVDTDEDLASALDKLGCQLQPRSGTYRAWLAQIAEQVRRATA